MVSLGLLPFIPILPGLGSLLALTLGLLAYRRLPAGRRGRAVVTIAIGGMGAMLALTQLLAALLAVLAAPGAER